MKNEKCETGCIIFTGGEIKHNENCVFYPESRTKMYDDLKEEVRQLLYNKIEIEDLINYIEKDAEISLPMHELIGNGGESLTKKQYGKILLKYLAKELRGKYC